MSDTLPKYKPSATRKEMLSRREILYNLTYKQHFQKKKLISFMLIPALSK